MLSLVNRVFELYRQKGLSYLFRSICRKVLSLDYKVLIIAATELDQDRGSSEIPTGFQIARIQASHVGRIAQDMGFDNRRRRECGYNLNQEAYGSMLIDPDNMVCYTCWYKGGPYIFPLFHVDLHIKSEEAFLFSAFCRPDARRQGFHYMMNQYRLYHIRKEGYTRALVAYTATNKPARIVQEKSGLSVIKKVHYVTFRQETRVFFTGRGKIELTRK